MAWKEADWKVIVDVLFINRNCFCYLLRLKMAYVYKPVVTYKLMII